MGPDRVREGAVGEDKPGPICLLMWADRALRFEPTAKASPSRAREGLCGWEGIQKRRNRAPFFRGASRRRDWLSAWHQLVDLSLSKPWEKLVRVRGFGPPAPASRRHCSSLMAQLPSRPRLRVGKAWASARNSSNASRPTPDEVTDYATAQVQYRSGLASGNALHAQLWPIISLGRPE
jgi:hypothetical protein